MADNEKKIIIDDDWKQQAQAEKEKLAEEAKQDKQQQQEKQLPEGNISALISMLTTQVLFALGVIVPKGSEKEQHDPDFELAKYNIDILADLQEKTKGNLSKEEDEMLKQTVSQLQMAFVQIKTGDNKGVK